MQTLRTRNADIMILRAVVATKVLAPYMHREQAHTAAKVKIALPRLSLNLVDSVST